MKQAKTVFFSFYCLSCRIYRFLCKSTLHMKGFSNGEPVYVGKIPFLEKLRCRRKITLMNKNFFLEKLLYIFFQICKWVKNYLKSKRQPQLMTDWCYKRSIFALNKYVRPFFGCQWSSGKCYQLISFDFWHFLWLIIL